MSDEDQQPEDNIVKIGVLASYLGVSKSTITNLTGCGEDDGYIKKRGRGE